MINSLKENRALRKKPKHNIFLFKEIDGFSKLKLSPSKLKKLSKSEFQNLSLKCKRERNKRRLKMFLAFIVAVIIFGLIVFAFVKYWADISIYF